MLHIHRILVITLLPAVMTALSACGQKGALFVPTLPAGVERATLPQTLDPTRSSTPAAPAPARGASSPVKP